MNSNSNKSALSTRDTNKEKCIIIEDFDEIYHDSVPKQIGSEKTIINQLDNESSFGYLSSNSLKRGLMQSKSMYEPRLKGIKLSQSPARSHVDSGILKLFQELYNYRYRTP